ncbi:MAG: hypothetical protein ACLTKQ_08495 [Acutalibacteraceae bacterium]
MKYGRNYGKGYPAAQLELNGKTYTINHMGTATYLRYKQACEAVSLEEDAIDAPTYTAIINALSIAFGEQFTPEELAESAQMWPM